MKTKLAGHTRTKKIITLNSRKVIRRHLIKIQYCRECGKNRDSFRGPHSCTVYTTECDDGQSNVGNSPDSFWTKGRI